MGTASNPGRAGRCRRSACRVSLTIAAMAAAVLGGCGGDNASALQTVEIGAPAPELSLPMHMGSGTMSLSELRGNVVLLNFWASWCPPCRQELPDLVSLYRDYNRHGLRIVGAVLNSPKRDVDRLIASHGIPYRVLTGTDDAARAWKAGNIPTTYIIDKEGIVRHQYVGAQARSVLEQDIVNLLQ